MDNMDVAVRQVEGAFLAELQESGDLWRLCRRHTFIDLINLYGRDLSDGDEVLLITIANLGLKFKINNQLGPLPVPADPESASGVFGRINKALIADYHGVLLPLKTGYENKTLYDLNNELINLGVICHLGLDNYDAGILDPVIGIALNILKNKNTVS
jgi:hypothetical protein